jgi:hypothetical protein
MSEELERALNDLCSMKRPSVATLLRRNLYEYEARKVQRLVAAWEEIQQKDTNERKPIDV